MVASLREQEFLTRNPEDGLPNQASFREHDVDWGDDDCAVSLGDSLIHDHAEQPDAEASRDRAADIVTFVASHPIAAGEEVVHRYRCPPWSGVR